MEFDVEKVWILYGIHVFNKVVGIKVLHNKGHVSQVTFNWKKGLNPFVLGWLHTHPDNYGCLPSEMDNRTMR